MRLIACCLSLFATTSQASEVADVAIARCRAELEEIAAHDATERTFENTVAAFDDAVSRLYEDTLWTWFQLNVHPELDVRELGETTRRKVSDFAVEIFLHEGVFDGLKAYAATSPALEGEQARLLEHALRDFRRAGMELPAEKREQLRQLEFDINEIEQEFSTNIRDDETTVAFLREELEGMPDDFLENLERSGDLYLVPTKPSSTTPIFQNCSVAATRHKISLAYGRRAGLKNVSVLEKIIRFRKQKAELLGYPTIAHFVTEDRMAQSPERVFAFYEDLRPKLRAKAQADFDELLAAKREYTGDPDAELAAWDSTFFKTYLLEHEYRVDQKLVREYFPIEAVFEGLFSITQNLFGLEYRDVSDRAAERGRPLWHEDVRLYEVRDKSTDQLLGEFYTDLHPRPNKYNHAAQFPLVPRKKWADGTVSRPVVALVCNFTKPTAEKPSLLSHGEVETFFHEFGHCLHTILTEADYGYFSGTSVARDFVEAPSQMLENWVWDAEVLKTFTRHYETGEPFPDEMLEGMLRARHLRSGLDAEYQLYLGMMDMRFHTDPDGAVDTTAVNEQTRAECLLLPSTPGTYSQAAFGHMTGYAAGYYGYLWSLVYAQDMFGRFRELGLLSPEAGAYYREKILSRGGTRDAIDLVTDYLGRAPSPDAFLQHLGLTPTGT